MNLWVRGECGHPAWLGGVEPELAFKLAPIGSTPAALLRMKMTVLRRFGIDAYMESGPLAPRHCCCRACVFLQLVTSDIYVKNRTLAESPPYRCLPDHSLVDRRTGALIRKGGAV